MGLFMIDEKNLLDWLQREYEKQAGINRNPYFGKLEKYCATSKKDLIQDLLIEIKQGRFNENQTKDV